MTIITPTGIAGINSITSTGNTLQFQNASGNAVNVSGVNVTSGTDINVSGIVTASGFVGNLSGNINATGVSTIATLNATQSNSTNLNVSGVTTATTLRATSIVGVTTAGITTAYVGSVNDGPISGVRNRIINGDMRIDQRNAGASVTRATTDSGGTFTLDRWVNNKNSNSKAYTIQRSGTAPVGFTSSLLFTVTSTDGTTGSAQYNDIRQPIEGFNVSDLMWGTSDAKSVTLSFWVRSSITGTYAVCLVIQGTGNYPATYTINSANTWEYKAITIPGATSGTWPIDNSRGLDINFDMGIGSGYSTTTNTWTYGQNVFGGSGVTKLTETNGATFYITGVQLEVGTVATPFERRSYGQELVLCQRYYEYGTASGSGYCAITGIFDSGAVASICFKSTKRSAPTISAPSLNSGVYPNTAAGRTVPTYEGGFSRGFRYTDINQSSFWNVTTGSGGSTGVCGFVLVWIADIEL
jgi:hypothetical protein